MLPIARTSRRILIPIVALIVASGSTCSGHAASVALTPDRDATILEEQTFTILANGAGAYLFAGRTHAGANRRALLAFPIAASIAPGAVITGASLVLRMSRTISGNANVRLHRLDADWGEGESNPAREEGAGAPAMPGDVTWTHRVYDTEPWLDDGGDFDPQATAEVAVGGIESYTLTSAHLVADVQDMLDRPEDDFGWILIGDETRDTTAKRFDSRDNATVPNWPRLVVEYRPAGDANCDGLVSAADLTAAVDIIATGERAPCGDDDANRDGDVDDADVDSIVERLFPQRPQV